MPPRSTRRGYNANTENLTPAIPIAEIRSRKWTKQLRTVGHLTLQKWVPDVQYPTSALQQGAFGSFAKKKGRKRSAGEVGRMTRSVRQHLDAPLELLPEYPSQRKANTTFHTTKTQVVVPDEQNNTMTTYTTVVQEQNNAKGRETASVKTETTSYISTNTIGSNSPLDDSLLSFGMQTTAQLEEDLGDLPILDLDESFLANEDLGMGENESYSDEAKEDKIDEEENEIDSQLSSSDDKSVDGGEGNVSVSPLASSSPATSPIHMDSP